MELQNHEMYMEIALKEAAEAIQKNEVPIGAIIVCKNKILAKAHNMVETLNDPTAHAEMLAISSAIDFLGSKYLPDCKLYVTLEPCVMCAGAITWSQIPEIYYGASDPQKGFSNYTPNIFNHKIKISKGILQDTCSSLITEFFKEKRKMKY